MNCWVITGGDSAWQKAVCIAVLESGIVCTLGELDVQAGKRAEGRPIFVDHSYVWMGENRPPEQAKPQVKRAKS